MQCMSLAEYINVNLRAGFPEMRFCILKGKIQGIGMRKKMGGLDAFQLEHRVQKAVICARH